MQRAHLRIALVAGAAFVALTTLVGTGLLDGWDRAVRSWARPDDVWGPWQIRVDIVVEGVRPAVLAAVLLAVTLVTCAVRRSLWPAVLCAGSVLVAGTLALATKAVLGRPDPHGAMTSSHGGSFPSGHVLAAVLLTGLVVLLIPAVGRWSRWLLPAAVGSVMAAALLIQAAHWASDVLGGALLGTAVLAGATAVPMRAPRVRAGSRSDQS